jgi:hypothetical protein
MKNYVRFIKVIAKTTIYISQFNSLGTKSHFTLPCIILNFFNSSEVSYYFLTKIFLFTAIIVQMFLVCTCNGSKRFDRADAVRT